jgi:hypothetical protein
VTRPLDRSWSRRPGTAAPQCRPGRDATTLGFHIILARIGIAAIAWPALKGAIADAQQKMAADNT